LDAHRFSRVVPQITASCSRTLLQEHTKLLEAEVIEATLERSSCHQSVVIKRDN